MKLRIVEKKFYDTVYYKEFRIGERVKADTGHSTLTPGVGYRILTMWPPSVPSSNATCIVEGYKGHLNTEYLIPAEDQDYWQREGIDYPDMGDKPA